LNSASIPTTGGTLSLAWNESVTSGSAGSNHIKVTASGGVVSVTNISGVGSASWTATLNRFIAGAETVTINVTNVANGIVDVGGTNAYAGVTNFSVSNNSNYESDPPTSLSFSTAPTPTRATSMTMTATATDASALTYYLEMNGASNTAAQASGVFNVSGLPVYSTNFFRFVATDAHGNANTSSFSGNLTWTQAVYTATGTFTVPADVTNLNLVECIGAGAGAGNPGGSGSARSGGGGGAYASTNNISVTPTTVHTVTVGAATAENTPGVPSWFSAVGIVRAVGGTNSSNAGPEVGDGGAASSSTGQTRYSGGSGGARDLAGGGGGGGGGASFSGPGTTGVAASGTTGGAGSAIGGGNGGNSTVNGSAGNDVGGGGGGSGINAASAGGGFRGQVTVHWLPPTGVPDDPPANDTNAPVVTFPTGHHEVSGNNFHTASPRTLSVAGVDAVGIVSVQLANQRTGAAADAALVLNYATNGVWDGVVTMLRGSNTVVCIVADGAGNTTRKTNTFYFSSGSASATSVTISGAINIIGP
jgi:hypothetical protein